MRKYDTNAFLKKECARVRQIRAARRMFKWKEKTQKKQQNQSVQHKYR